MLPIAVCRALRKEIEGRLEGDAARDYVPFAVEDYVDNPVALARINAHMIQKEPAKRMKVSQAYISKIESQAKVTPKVLQTLKRPW